MAEPLFSFLEIPYWNALTAGQFDASSSFDANMPASHVAYSLQTLALYQAPGQTVRPDVLKWPEVQQAGVPESEPGACDYLDLACYGEKFLSSDVVKDYAKRTGLVLLAIVLIALAIVSLR